MILYHFTCQRNAALIEITGELRPRPQALFCGMPIVWLSTQHRKNLMTRQRLGLTWHTTRQECHHEDPICDPVAARFSVLIDESDPKVMPFASLADRHPSPVRMYRSLPGSQPGTWWVATRALPIHVPVYRRGRARVYY